MRDFIITTYMKGQGATYLHGDVCYGCGGQVEVLLDQNVEFGGQMPPSSNAVNLTGEQRGNLTQQEGNTESKNSCDRDVIFVLMVSWAPRQHPPLSSVGQTRAFPHPVGKCELKQAHTAGWPSV